MVVPDAALRRTDTAPRLDPVAFRRRLFRVREDPDDDGAVWALDITLSNFTMPEPFSLNPSAKNRRKLDDHFSRMPEEPHLHLLNMGLRNERMVAQQGVFMLSDDPAAPHDKILADLASGAKARASSERYGSRRR